MQRKNEFVDYDVIFDFYRTTTNRQPPLRKRKLRIGTHTDNAISKPEFYHFTPYKSTFFMPLSKYFTVKIKNRNIFSFFEQKRIQCLLNRNLR